MGPKTATKCPLLLLTLKKNHHISLHSRKSKDKESYFEITVQFFPNQFFPRQFFPRGSQYFPWDSSSPDVVLPLRRFLLLPWDSSFLEGSSLEMNFLFMNCMGMKFCSYELSQRNCLGMNCPALIFRPFSSATIVNSFISPSSHSHVLWDEILSKYHQ